MNVSGKSFVTLAELVGILLPLRKKGMRVATTNGCFDLVHAGHVQYLSEAARSTDILVVGVNCDAVVRKLKGKSRPVNGENDRALVISSLKMVDYSFIFHEDDPRTFLEVIKPDIHIKGGDYTENIIERPIVEKNGGKVQIVSFKDGYSTTSILGRASGS